MIDALSRLRRLRVVLAAVAMALVLASCNVDITLDVAMKPDGSGTITLTLVADAEVVERAPNLTTDLRLDDARAAGWTVQGPTPGDTGGLQLVLTHPFATPAEATSILASMNGVSGPLKGITLERTKKDDTTTYSLGGLLQVDGGLDAFSDADLFAALGSTTPYSAQAAAAGVTPAQAVTFTFRAKLPGTVKTSTATAGSASAPAGLAWGVPLDGTAPIDVTTTSTSKATRNVWASPLATGAKILLVVWIVAAGFFILYVAVARRRRRQIRALR